MFCALVYVLSVVCRMTLPRYRLSRGLLIVFEGIDGSGKTTQIRLLDERLRREGYDVICLKEPTDGPWGQKLRQLAQHGRQQVAPATELEWFLQDRREDVEHNIQPALARGQLVLLDRYYFSTIAYQGVLQFDPEELRARNEAFAPAPDLLFLLDVTPKLGLQRVQKRGEPSHFESLDYLKQVAAIFATLQFPYLRRINTSADLTAVQEHIWQNVVTLLASTAKAAPTAVQEDTV